MFNETLKTLRLSHNLNQVQLAQKLNVSKQTISNWENNNIQPSIDMLIKIADTFSVTTDYLLGRENRAYIDVSDLTSTQRAHIQQIISDILDTNQKNKIIMTAVDTKEYFKLKEGLKIIDPKVFISIVDSYEVVNKNLTIGENHIIK